MKTKKTLKLQTSEIRGKIGSEINAKVITDFGCAFGSLVKSGPVVVGRDGRESGEHYARSIISAMNSMGLEVYALGLVSTATLAVAARELNCSGAISITPGPLGEKYSGLKFLNGQGRPLDSARFKKMMSLYRGGKFKYVGFQRVGRFKMDYSCLGRHIQQLTEMSGVELMDINRAQMTVVVDCANACSSSLAPQFLRCLGVKVIELNCHTGGSFAHSPDVGKSQTEELSRAVRRHRADAGLIIDADGSRLGLVDERGQYVPLETMLMMAVRQIGRVSSASVGVEKGKLLRLRRLAQDSGRRIWDCRPEGAEICAGLRRRRGAAAVNSSGSLIYPAGNSVEDALVTSALVLSDLAKSRESLSQTARLLV